MCGIVGFATTKPRASHHGRASFVAQGLYVDALRGESGTGLGLIKNDTVEVYKRAMKGADFLDTDVGVAALKDFDEVTVAIGHNRFPTQGKNKDFNCHPFHFTDNQEILLVHNGTVHGYHSFLPTGFNHDVDSANVARALAGAKTPDGQLEILNKLSGSFVLVWYNKTQRTFNIARNEFREIYWTFDNDNNIYFASEDKMLGWLVDRNSIPEPKEGFKFYYPEDNQWMEWDATKPYNNDTVVREIVKWQPPAVVNNGSRTFYGGLQRRLGYEPDFGDTYLPNEYPTYRDSQFDVLADYGYKMDELVAVEFKSFVPYPAKGNAPKFGRIEGVAMDDLALPAVIHGVKEEDIKWLKKHFKTGLPARITGIKDPIGTKDPDVLQCTMKKDDVQYFAKEQKDEKMTWQEIRERDQKVADAVNKAIKENSLPKEQDFDYLPGPGTVLLEKKEWLRLTAVGCGWCDDQPKLVEARDLHWIPYSNPVTFLCKHCYDNPEVKEAAMIGRKPAAGEMN